MPVELPEDFEDFKTAVLLDSREDGRGVYEVWWEANTHYPSLSVSIRLRIAERLVTDLLVARDMRLVRGRWIGPEHERTPVPDPGRTLSEWAAWVPQENDVVWMSATEPG